MGLDWNPASRPRPGNEEAFRRAKARLDRLAEQMPWRLWLRDFLAKRFSVGHSRDQLWAAFEEVAVTPDETLGAPRVGIDDAATAWAKAQYNSLETKPSSLQGYLAKLHGVHVPDVLPPCDGLPVYSNGRAYSGIDLYSFRGKFLEECRAVLGRRLLDEAWEKHDAGGLVDYGDRLIDAARGFAAKHGTSEWLDRREPPTEDEGVAAQTHIVASAAKWCRFWGERGHGLEPYY